MKNNLFVSLFLLGSLSLFACGSSSVNVNVNANSNANAVAAEPVATPAGSAGEPQSENAKALVADLYKQHDAQKGPFFQAKERASLDKYFTKQLADLIWKDATTAGDEVGAIDGDPLYDAQDMEIKNFAIGDAVVKGTAATLPVTFTNFGKKVTITYSLKQENKAWKIDNISYSRGDSLLKWLKETYPDGAKADSGGEVEFEGKYVVGDTTCTVKPVKMAFEVRWAKGSGTEMFFYKEGNTFESTADGRVNQFVFDSVRYDSGTFYRADGKTFAIKRAK
jgi:hypothetical protein